VIVIRRTPASQNRFDLIDFISYFFDQAGMFKDYNVLFRYVS
jgi:hypothetical protein